MSDDSAAEHTAGSDGDDPLVGSVLDGRYRLDRLIGEGGMGRVYAGTQLSVGREVAIKLLRGQALAHSEVKDRFFREAKVISGFSHPHIVRLIDYGQDDDQDAPYLVMELVRGVALSSLNARGRLAVPLALEVARQVCGALIQAHSAGIVHRDLKPDNLQLVPVVGDSFQVKVLDFGIAFPSDTDARLTSTGMICGTSYYMAPEQARSQDIDGRADLYALGIILYEMLSGYLPFRAQSDFQIMLMQVQREPPNLADYLPADEVPRQVIDLVGGLMAKDRDKRPASARVVRERIEAIRRDADIPALRLDLEDASADAFDPWIDESDSEPPGSPDDNLPDDNPAMSEPTGPSAGAPAAGSSDTRQRTLVGIAVALSVVVATMAGLAVYLLVFDQDTAGRSTSPPQATAPPRANASADDGPAVRVDNGRPDKAPTDQRATHHGDPDAPTRAAQETATSAPAAAPKPPEHKPTSASPSGSPEPARPSPATAGAGRPSAPDDRPSDNGIGRYKRRVQAAGRRCADAQDAYKQKIDHYKQLLTDGRRQEAKRFQQDVMIPAQDDLRTEIRAAANSYGRALREVLQHSGGHQHAQELSAIFQKSCRHP